MISKNKLRERLIKRIKKLSDDKLSSVESFMDELEDDLREKSEILSFAGIFKDLDKETMADLTTRLPERRMQGNSRIQ